jgi:tetratricopeptide (TPR) repeat protein
VLAIATVALFSRTFGFDFIHYDDPEYVFRNDYVQQGLNAQTVRYAFTSRALSHWHPLTWLSFMLDAELFGIEPRVFHRTNVVLHAGSAVLLFLALRIMTDAPWRSGLAAAIFALHPLRVESVAWVAERKDVLSTFLGLLALLLYVIYARRGSIWMYIATILAFAMSLLAKSMLVTLPLVLLLLDYWPLGRFRGPQIRRVILEKVPLLALSAASATMTLFIAGGTGAVHGFGKVALWPRISNAIVAHVEYLFDMIWPAGLVVLYPFPEKPSLENTLICAALLGIITFVAIAWIRQRPNVFVGWFWFLIVLLPVNGIISIGELSRADRYTYVPMIGTILAVVWSLPDLRGKPLFARAAVATAAILVLVAMSLVTWRQLAHWRNSGTLFDHTLAVIGSHPTIEMNYGAALADRGDHAGAALRYQNALKKRPNWAPLLANIASELSAAGRSQEALYYYLEAVKRDPRQPMIYFNMGIALMKLDRWADAEKCFIRTLELRPDFEPARQNLAYVREQIQTK